MAHTALWLFDIDGTLCEAVDCDDPALWESAQILRRKPTWLTGMVRELVRAGELVRILTARSEDVREATERWLGTQGIDGVKAYMRPLDVEPAFRNAWKTGKLQSVAADIHEMGQGGHVVLFDDTDFSATCSKCSNLRFVRVAFPYGTLEAVPAHPDLV